MIVLNLLIVLREFKIFISRAPARPECRPEFALGERGSCYTARFFQTPAASVGGLARGARRAAVLKIFTQSPFCLMLIVIIIL